MAKDLKDMTLEELWELFPIELVAHRAEWRQWASEEMALLSELLARYPVTISHIGSTSIPGIRSKPIVDILVEAGPGFDIAELRGPMEDAGYILMSATPRRLSFNKGYTPAGYAERVFHIHVHPAGDDDEIRFRDYLLRHPSVAREYEALKLRLLALHPKDRDAYTAAKTPFVTRITRLSRQQCEKTL